MKHTSITKGFRASDLVTNPGNLKHSRHVDAKFVVLTILQANQRFLMVKMLFLLKGCSLASDRNVWRTIATLSPDFVLLFKMMFTNLFGVFPPFALQILSTCSLEFCYYGISGC